MNDQSSRVPVHGGGAFWPQLLEPLRHFGAAVADFFTPSADAVDAEDAYVVTIELPGVKQEDIEVSLDDRVLTIRGEKRREIEEKTDSYYFSERSYGAFRRAFRVPDDVDPDKLDAGYADGVLTVTLPRVAPRRERTRRIEVRRH